MQRLLIPLLFAAVIAGIFFMRQTHNLKAVEKQSELFVLEAAGDISNGWNAATFRGYADPALASQSGVDAAFASYRRLGNRLNAPQCKAINSEAHRYKVESGSYFTVDYECGADFPRGPAVMKIRVCRYLNEDLWKILSFNVSSSFFNPPPP